MSFQRHRREPVNTENSVFYDPKKAEIPKIAEEIKEAETPVNTVVEVPPVKEKIIKKRILNVNKVVEETPKKPVVANKKAPAKKRKTDDIRGLELNATNGELDGNVMVARNFKAICKLKGLKINRTLHSILTAWINKNQLTPQKPI